MTSPSDLLVEIGTEELPPKALFTLSNAFRNEVKKGLQEAALIFTGIEAFATPRRLALKIIALETKQPDRLNERFGPAVKAAFDEHGKASKAAEGFARSCGVEVSQLQQKNDGKVLKLFYSAKKPGELTSKLLPEIISRALAALPIPKRMRWGSSREEFVRPVHWVVLLFGNELIPATILGLETNTITYGHRFLHQGKIQLDCPDDYPSILEETAYVVPSFEKRKEQIRALLLQEAKTKNARVIIDEELLDEVTALVEWPVALTGTFDEAYLNIPKEALISSLKTHQKCFYLLDKNGQLLAYFITISNLISKDPQQVILGNEKVIGPRLADAAFFFDQDKKHKLEAHLETLKRVVFQNELGSVFDKTQRVKKLSGYLAQQFNFNTVTALRAAELGKCDLLSSMVGEFADLQGIMGHYYALHDGESEEVAVALEEQYLPRFSGDFLPESESGLVLALAERLDTIVGLFAIGQPPSGSKDPFALRRSALGVLRILLEKQLTLDLQACVTESISYFDKLSPPTDLTQTILDFIYDRLRAYYADLGISTSVFLAVDAVRSNNPLTFNQQIIAVNHFTKLPEAQSLAGANKRVANILAKLDIIPSQKITTKLLTEPAELQLAEHLQSVLSLTGPLIQDTLFQEALTHMATLQTPLDQFFETVMVNTDDMAVRQNRQALLYQIRQLFLQIADISYLQTS